MDPAHIRNIKQLCHIGSGFQNLGLNLSKLVLKKRTVQKFVNRNYNSVQMRCKNIV
jgi:hypothetical protein